MSADADRTCDHRSDVCAGCATAQLTSELEAIRHALGVSAEFSIEPLANAIRQMREECATHERTKAELTAALAEAAAMVVRFKSLLTESARLTDREGEAWLPFVLMLIDQVVAESPGRALAARVPLLEQIYRWVVSRHFCDTALDNILGKLAALDEKGGG